jgi:hypothetical protein
MTDADASPRLQARIAGLFYLVTIVAGVFAMMARASIIVKGDAAATAANILGQQALYRASFCAELMGTLSYVAVTAILYGLLRPVSRTISLVAAFISLTGCAIGAVSSVSLLAPLVLLSNPPFLSAIPTDQLQAMAYLALRMQNQGAVVGMVCFGFYCLTLGYLCFRSDYFPRTVGVLLGIAGLAWLADTLGGFLSPALGRAIGDAPLLLGFVGEGSLMLWLLVVGVKLPPGAPRTATQRTALAH